MLFRSGLCRTEHMFFDEKRIPAVRQMIMADNEDQRRKALEKILPMQREDFIGIYEAMEERPVTIRFLDPPLHEFLPTDDEDIKEILEDLFHERLNLNKELWSIIFGTCKLGDNFYEIIPDDYVHPTQISRIRYLDPRKTNRIEKNGKLAF